jgi:NAD(P)H-flavin reductase
VTSGGGPRLVFVYAVVGEGTAELASYAPGTELRILGPQGNGYDRGAAGRRVLLIGGGLGIPPLLFAARRLREGVGLLSPAPDAEHGAGPGPGEHTETMSRAGAKPDGEVKITALLGYRDEPYYSEEMRRYCDEVFDISELWESRESGEARGRPERDSGAGPERCAHKTRHGGVRSLRGTVMDLIARLEEDGALDLAGTSVLACGPLPMLRAVSEWAAARGVPAQVSLEERMGCGYGACVGCTITVKAEGAGTGLHNVASVAEACGPQVAEISEGQVDEISSGQSTSTSSKRNIATCGLVRRKVCKDGPVFPSDVIVW